jgi:hypothetical protein
MADVDVPNKKNKDTKAKNVNKDQKGKITKNDEVVEVEDAEAPSANTNDPKLKELYKQIRDIHSKQIKVHKYFEAAFYNRKNKISSSASETVSIKVSQTNINELTQEQVKLVEGLHSSLMTTVGTINDAYIDIQRATASFPDDFKPMTIAAQREAENAIKNANKAKSLTEEALELAKASISGNLTPKQKQIATEKANAAAIAAVSAVNQTEIAAISMLQKISNAKGEINQEGIHTLNDAAKPVLQTAKQAAITAKQTAKLAVNKATQSSAKAKQVATSAKKVIQNVTNATKTALQEIEKSIENNVSERTNMLVLLNDLINETSVMSMQTDKRYLYVMEYKQDKNSNAKIFDNEDIKEEEPTINDKIKDVAANSIEKVKEVGKQTSQIAQDVGSSLGRIIKNKLTKSENVSRIEAEVSNKLPRAQQEAEIAKVKAITAEAKAKIERAGLESKKQSGGANDDLNQKLSFIANKDDIDKLVYKDLVIVEYSTKNVSEIDKDVIKPDQDYYKYISNFQEFIKNNNDGKGMNFADRTKDRSLLVKRYPIHQYFSFFNKNIGFDYKSVKDNYIQNAGKYKDNVEKYSKRLDKFFDELENFKNNDGLNTIENKFEKSLNNIQFLFQKYYGFILIIILIIILFASYLDYVIRFFNSVYSQKMSLSPSLINNSMYDSYARIFSMTIMGNEQYFDYKTMLHFVIYVVLFIMIVSINIYYLADSYNGRLRVMNFIPHPWSTHEVYIFDKRANTLMFYGIVLLIVIIILNMIYYFTVFTQSDIFKTRYESHNEIQNLYNNINLELLDLFLRSDVYEENKDHEPIFLDSYDAKLASWMFNGTEDEINSRIGKTDDKELKNKRLKILMTIVFANHFVSSKYKRALFDIPNIGDLSNTEKPSIFLYSKEETLDGVLPSDYSNILSKDSETMRIILADPKSGIVSKYNNIKTNNKCNPDDKRYVCKDELNNYKIIDENAKESLKYFDDEYKKIYKQIQKQRIKIKSKDSAIMYRVDVILSFIFMLILGLCLIQIFLWLFFDNLDIYEAFISKHISKIKTIFQIIVLIIILIVIL